MGSISETATFQKYEFHQRYFSDISSTFQEHLFYETFLSGCFHDFTTSLIKGVLQ